MKCKCGHDSYNHRSTYKEEGIKVTSCDLCPSDKAIHPLERPDFTITTNDVVDKAITVFASGAKRGSTKPRYDQIDLYFLKRIADVWEKGLVKYGEGNWRLGVSNDVKYMKDIPNHIIEHIWKYMLGDKSEDHLANICCNVQMLMYREYLDAGQKTAKTD